MALVVASTREQALPQARAPRRAFALMSRRQLSMRAMDGIGPEEQIAERIIVAVARERPGDVDERGGVEREVLQSGCELLPRNSDLA